MKKLFTGFAVALVAAVWMMGSWFFFNSIAVGAQGSNTPAAGEVNKGDPQDTGAAKCKCGEQWKHDHRGQWKHRHGMCRLWKKLDLTDAQKTQMKSIMAETRTKIKPLVQKLKEGRVQLRALVKSGSFDEAKVRSIAKGQADTLIQLIVEKERMKSSMYAVLTPEQRAKAEKLREAWKTLHEQGPEHKD